MATQPDHDAEDHRILMAVKQQLDRVETQTTLTNGKVATLRAEADDTKRVLWGDPLDPSDHGLVSIRRDVERVVAGFDRATKVGTWLAGALVTSAITVASALVFG